MIKRQLTEMPQPARLFLLIFLAACLGILVLGGSHGAIWVARVGAGVAGLAIFLFGFYIFRDINGTASILSRVYKESRGIAAEQFTFADVPTLRGLGFFYMILGLGFAAGAIFG